MLTGVVFHDELHTVSDMMSGNYSAFWNGKPIWIIIHLNAKSDEYIQVFDASPQWIKREPIVQITSREIRQAGKAHMPFKELVAEYLTKPEEDSDE